jgi:hypothetical protein
MAKRKPKKKKEETPSVEGIYTQAIAIAADFFRDGASEQHVAELIRDNFSQLTDANVQLVVHKSSQLIADQYVRDRKNVVALHTRRYNQEIKKLLEDQYGELTDEDQDAPEEGKKDEGAKRRKRRIYQLTLLLDVMTAKEKVLQIHTKETQVKIYNQLNAKVKEKKVMFNLADLTLQEKIEFLSLIQKAKKDDTELFSVKLSDTKQLQTTEDAEFEVVENDNIEKIKRTNEPKELPPPKPKKNLNDVQEQLKKALQRKALKQIRKAGGDKGGPHIIDVTDV